MTGLTPRPPAAPLLVSQLTDTRHRRAMPALSN
ncbi:hypothetical protein SANTM175S_01704 [Streptomyces antimycoticus]